MTSQTKQDDNEWSTAKWLQGLQLEQFMAPKMFPGLNTPEEQFDAVKASNKEFFLKLLMNPDFVDDLATFLGNGAGKLTDPEVSKDLQLNNSKFAQETFELKFGIHKLIVQMTGNSKLEVQRCLKNVPAEDEQLLVRTGLLHEGLYQDTAAKFDAIVSRSPMEFNDDATLLAAVQEAMAIKAWGIGMGAITLTTMFQLLNVPWKGFEHLSDVSELEERDLLIFTKGLLTKYDDGEEVPLPAGTWGTFKEVNQGRAKLLTAAKYQVFCPVEELHGAFVFTGRGVADKRWGKMGNIPLGSKFTLLHTIKIRDVELLPGCLGMVQQTCGDSVVLQFEGAPAATKLLLREGDFKKVTNRDAEDVLMRLTTVDMGNATLQRIFLARFLSADPDVDAILRQILKRVLMKTSNDPLSSFISWLVTACDSTESAMRALPGGVIFREHSIGYTKFVEERVGIYDLDRKQFSPLNMKAMLKLGDADAKALFDLAPLQTNLAQVSEGDQLLIHNEHSNAYYFKTVEQVTSNTFQTTDGATFAISSGRRGDQDRGVRDVEQAYALKWAMGD